MCFSEILLFQWSCLYLFSNLYWLLYFHKIKPKFSNIAFKVLCDPPGLCSHPPLMPANSVFYTLAILDYLYLPIIPLLQYQVFIEHVLCARHIGKPLYICSLCLDCLILKYTLLL